MIAEYTPERTYQPHSGAFNIENRFQTGGTRTGTRELWTHANPTHYYTHKEDGAWGFAQSGGIGGIFAPIESMRRMMPEESIWPPFNETFSFHTVIQGVEYFDALFASMDKRYGKPTNAEDFALKGQVLNYESARGMFEAYGRNKFDALGITTWKYDVAWPAALTWQYVDWYLIAGGAYYGAKKACEPLHVQYSYDDDSIWVINGYYEPFNNLKVTARVLNFDLSEKLEETVTVSVEENGKVQALNIDWPRGLSKSHFLVLTLQDDTGEEVSSNLYWLSTVPDVEGTKGYSRDRGFYIRPKSVADHRDLMKLPQVQLDMDYQIEDAAPEKAAVVRLNNSSENLAFFVHLAVTQGEDGPEVAPVYWSDNYFSLLPGQEKSVRGVFADEDLQGASAVVKLDGWNVEPQ
jgi:exo-1,4-beta-D-glucosaminidase